MRYVSGLTFIFTFLLIASCNLAPDQTRSGSNNSSSLNTGHAFIMVDSPSVQNPNLARLPLNVNQFLASEPKLVTTKSNLSFDCLYGSYSVTDCMRVLRNTSSTTPLAPTDGVWDVEANSAEYLQVHSLYHAKTLAQRFFDSLEFTQNYITSKSLPYTTAPSLPFNSLGPMPLYWLGPSTAPQHNTSTLDITVFCPDLADGIPNVSYSPAERRLCLGSETLFNNVGFHFAQDPEVIYHEMGHVMIEIMTNLRNGNSPIKTDLGFLAFDEALSINEGIADYFSYIMTERDRVFDWGLGQGATAAGFQGSTPRPVSEADSIHVEGVEDNANQRLAYPQFTTYNPGQPTTEIEDVHNTGQIISHYLVNMTKDFQNFCSISQDTAENYVMLLITESLAELGDLSSQATDLNTSGLFFTNLAPDVSYDWIKTTQTINIQRFFQVFAKYTLHYITMDLCNAYSKDLLESRLDNYGLLLFNDYNDEGLDSSGTSNIALATGNQVQPFSLNTINPLNRSRTTMVSKSQISLPTLEETRPQLYLIDSQEGVNNLISGKFFQGNPLSLTLSDELTGTRYNNDNRFFSPGEVVGFSLNLVNDSNIPLSGVQVLANNWDHMKKDPLTGRLKPCSFDGFPGLAEGGISDSNPMSPADGDCMYASRASAETTPLSPPIDTFEPVCFVQKVDGSDTEWITQDEFRQNPSLGLSGSQCLGPQGNQNPNECLVRIVPGGDFSMYSKIDPNKTWAETLYAGQSNPVFAGSGFIVMELSKWIPQGTLFNCRLRVRFSNCSDCAQDSNLKSYPDYEYSGSKPYQLINFQFRVVN